MKRAKRMDLFQSSIFTELKNMKLDYMKRTGNTTIDFSVGSPNIAPEPSIMKALQDAIMVPENYKYALTDRPFLLEAVQNFYKRRFGVSIEPEEIIDEVAFAEKALKGKHKKNPRQTESDRCFSVSQSS